MYAMDNPIDQDNTPDPDAALAQPTYPDVHVQLSEMDGNAVALITGTARAIRRKYGHDAAEDFTRQARQQSSYDDVLQFIMASVETS